MFRSVGVVGVRVDDVIREVFAEPVVNDVVKLFGLFLRRVTRFSMVLSSDFVRSGHSCLFMSSHNFELL